MASDKEPRRDQYKNEKSWRIARRRFFRKRQRQTDLYKQKLQELRDSGYKVPDNRPLQNQPQQVRSVPWA